MAIILRVKNNTTFKQHWHLQSKELKEEDKYVTKVGERFVVSNIERDVQKYDGHWKVAFDKPLQPKAGTAKITWFVYASDLEELSEDVPKTGTLRVKNNTTFKQHWHLQSTELKEEDKYVTKAGEGFPVKSIERDIQKYDNHWKVAFDKPLQPKQGTAKTTWFVYARDVVYEP